MSIYGRSIEQRHDDPFVDIGNGTVKDTNFCACFRQIYEIANHIGVAKPHSCVLTCGIAEIVTPLGPAQMVSRNDTPAERVPM